MISVGFGDISDIIDKILLWKKEYGDVFYLKVGNDKYIYRALTRQEYFNIYTLNKYSAVRVEDILLFTCLLYPEYDEHMFDNKFSGEIEYLVRCIVDSSGFSNTDGILKDIQKEREKVDLLDNQILLLICKAFPHLTPKDIDNMNYNMLLKYLTLAEAILDVKLKVEKPVDKNKIDFEKDNETLRGSKRKVPPKQKPRGDVS